MKVHYSTYITFSNSTNEGGLSYSKIFVHFLIKIMYETTREANFYGMWAFLLERPESCKLTVDKTTKKYLQSGSLVISCKEGKQTKLSVEGPPSTTQPLTLGVLGWVNYLKWEIQGWKGHHYQISYSKLFHWKPRTLPLEHDTSTPMRCRHLGY